MLSLLLIAALSAAPHIASPSLDLGGGVRVSKTNIAIIGDSIGTGVAGAYPLQALLLPEGQPQYCENGACSLQATENWPDIDPASIHQTDNTNYTFGTAFSVNTGAHVVLTAVRWYKDAGDTGAHTIRAWVGSGGSTGIQLGSVVATGESSSGWQETAVSPPIWLHPGVTYVVTKNKNTSYYVYTFQGLLTPKTTDHITSIGGRAGTTDGVYPTGYSSQNWFVYPVVRLANAMVTSGARVINFSHPGDGSTAIKNQWLNQARGKWKWRRLVLQGGINDTIGSVSAASTASNFAEVIAAADGARITAVSPGPFSNFSSQWTEARQTALEDLIAWEKTTLGESNVVDSYALLVDPETPYTLLPAFDWYDNLHWQQAAFDAVYADLWAKWGGSLK